MCGYRGQKTSPAFAEEGFEAALPSERSSEIVGTSFGESMPRTVVTPSEVDNIEEKDMDSIDDGLDGKCLVELTKRDSRWDHH